MWSSRGPTSPKRRARWMVSLLDHVRTNMRILCGRVLGHEAPFAVLYAVRPFQRIWVKIADIQNFMLKYRLLCYMFPWLFHQKIFSHTPCRPSSLQMALQFFLRSSISVPRVCVACVILRTLHRPLVRQDLLLSLSMLQIFSCLTNRDAAVSVISLFVKKELRFTRKADHTIISRCWDEETITPTERWNRVGHFIENRWWILADKLGMYWLLRTWLSTLLTFMSPCRPKRIEPKNWLQVSYPFRLYTPRFFFFFSPWTLLPSADICHRMSNEVRRRYSNDG